VLKYNWETVKVFMRCEPTLVIGATAAIWRGAPAPEIEAVMRLCRVPTARRLRVFDGVKQMGIAWAQVRNESK
jgi:hypothetical protein